MNEIYNMTLEKVLFYLSILNNPKPDLIDLSLQNISIKVYGSIHKDLSPEKLKFDLQLRLNFFMQDAFISSHNFTFTPEKYPSINSRYYGQQVTYILKLKEDKIDLISTSIH